MKDKPLCYQCADKPAKTLNLSGEYGKVKMFCSLKCAAKNAVESGVCGTIKWCPYHQEWLGESDHQMNGIIVKFDKGFGKDDFWDRIWVKLDDGVEVPLIPKEFERLEVKPEIGMEVSVSVGDIHPSLDGIYPRTFHADPASCD